MFLGSLFDGISGSGSILDPYAMAFGWTVFWNFKKHHKILNYPRNNFKVPLKSISSLEDKYRISVGSFWYQAKVILLSSHYKKTLFGSCKKMFQIEGMEKEKSWILIPERDPY